MYVESRPLNYIKYIAVFNILSLQLCDTYPRNVYVPAIANSPVIIGSSKFRSRSRLPTLSYLHRENQVKLFITKII